VALVLRGDEAEVTDSIRRRGGRRPATPGPEDAWLVDVAEGASRDAGGVPVELLGDYLPLLADAATRGRRANPRQPDGATLAVAPLTAPALSGHTGVGSFVSPSAHCGRFEMTAKGGARPCSSGG
jgi:hypothetical protein